jgi:hypothetical protein
VDDTTGSLTGLLTEFGALWDIISGPYGFAAQRRPPPSRPLILTAATATALRQLLEHGYDVAKLAAIIREFSGTWEIEHVNPGFRSPPFSMGSTSWNPVWYRCRSGARTAGALAWPTSPGSAFTAASASAAPLTAPQCQVRCRACD